MNDPFNLTNLIVLGIMLVGLTGLVIPIFPGLLVIWLAALGYGLIAGFATPGWIFFAIITIFFATGSVLDNVVMGRQAYKDGASLVSILSAMVFGILGNLVFPVIGGFIGALLALFLVEWIRRKNWREAMTATRGWAVGCGWAVAVRFLFGVMMIGLWMIWAIV
jgi:uncharacterized protein YqgC (DUF456 family)